MEVLLLQKMHKLGNIGDIVTVKSGYARNFLLPQHMAIRATPEKIELFQKQKIDIENKYLTERTNAEKIAFNMNDITISLIRQASDIGHLYGSVTTRDIVKGLSEIEFNIHKNQVILNQTIKSLGIHDLQIKLHPEIMVKIKVNVARSIEDAHEQLAQYKETLINTEINNQ